MGFLSRFSDRNWRDRTFAPILSHTRATDGPGELLLTVDHMLAYIDHKLAARRTLREDRQKSARKGWDTRRAA